MHAYARRTGSAGRDWLAMFRPHTRRRYGPRGYERTIPEFGEILITRRYVESPDVLTHECVHAAIEECRRRRRDLDLTSACNTAGLSTQQRSTEERICLVAGHLVEGIVNRWDREQRRLGRAS